MGVDPSRLFLALLLGVLLLFPSATILFLGMGLGGETQGVPEKKAYSLGTGTPPKFNSLPLDPSTGDWGSPIAFRIVVYDADYDTVNITWDWGDGTSDTNLSVLARPAKQIFGEHTYTPTPVPGYEGYVYFTLNISLDDGNGNVVWNLTTVGVKQLQNLAPTLFDFSLTRVGSKVRVNPGDEVTITANASDPEGEALTWTFVFNNSIEDYLVVVNHTDGTAPGANVSCNFTHTFGAEGNYVVYLYLTDSIPPYDLIFPHNQSEDLAITVYANAAPMSASGSEITIDPGNPMVRSEIGYVIVNYSIAASDLDGDALTATWNFDDGSPAVVQTFPGGTDNLYTFVEQRNYTDTGFFNVSATITDGVPGHEIYFSAFVLVNSTNRPPSLLLVDFNMSTGSYGLRNELLNFTLIFTDAENDTIQVIIDFGDNTPRLYFNLTEYVEGNLTLVFSHFYSNAGNYSINVYFTDNKIGAFNHSRLSNITITVKDIPTIIETSWSWWDYTCLALVCLIPVLAVARFIQMFRRRKFLEDQGMTYEEWKLLKSVKADEPPAKKEGGP